jgi:putative ABC transport system permease protein
VVPLARRNLLSEKGRFALSVGGVAFAVLLILLVVSLYRGWSDVGRLYTQLPGDLWISQPQTTDPYHSSSFLPAADASTLATVPGVAAAMPVYTRHIAFQRDGIAIDVLAMALDAPPGLRLPTETRKHYLPLPGRINIDRMLARDAGVGPGDRLTVLGRRLVVNRINTGGNTLFQAAFLNPRDARELWAGKRLASFILLSLKLGADRAEVAAAAAAALPGTESHTSEQFATSFAGRVNDAFLAVVGVLVGLGFLVGGAVIGLTAYTATVERAREFAVLKAIGASGVFLYRVVLRQSLIIGSLGAGLGVGWAAAAGPVIERRVPEFVTELRWIDASSVFLTAVLVAALASYVPIRRLNRIDPAVVFRA